jgi:hypothetical protein
MQVIVGGRQSGKSTDIVALAAQHHAYIVVPTRADAVRLWNTVREQSPPPSPMPISWSEFIKMSAHRGRRISCFVIDDLDRCLQQMCFEEIKAVSITGTVTGRKSWKIKTALRGPATWLSSWLTSFRTNGWQRWMPTCWRSWTR